MKKKQILNFSYGLFVPGKNYVLWYMFLDFFKDISKRKPPRGILIVPTTHCALQCLLLLRRKRGLKKRPECCCKTRSNYTFANFSAQPDHQQAKTAWPGQNMTKSLIDNYSKIKASEMLVAPRISECFGLL